MRMPTVSLLEWQKRFETENACIETLIKVRWPDGFFRPECASKNCSYIVTRNSYQCSHCHHQTSATSGTIFHSINLPLVKWFWAIYLVAADKGGISALRLSKHIGVSWVTAHRMLRKIRMVMAHRDSIYRLENLIECDDALVGGKRAGKRGRGAAGKKPVLLAVEKRGKHAGFINTRDVKPTCPDPFTTEADALSMGCWPVPEVSYTVNTDELGDLKLNPEEDAIVAFLKTLSDGYRP